MLAATDSWTRLWSLPLAMVLLLTAASLTAGQGYGAPGESYGRPYPPPEQRGVAGQEVPAPAMETRVFDIRSLLLDVPDYRAIFSDLRSDDLYGSGMRAGTGFVVTQPHPEAAGAPSKVAETNAGKLMRIVQSVINPQSWGPFGGHGSVDYYAGQLVVTNEPKVIVEVENLLNTLKASGARKVRIDADFVVVPRKDGGQGVSEELLQRDRFLLPEEFRKLLDSKKGQVDVTHVTVSGFDGQRVATTSGTQMNVVAEMLPLVAQQVNAYQPMMRQLVEGVTFEAQPVWDKERSVVLVDVRASLGHLLPREEGKTQDAPRSPAKTSPGERGEAGSTTRPAGSEQKSLEAALLGAMAAGAVSSAADVQRAGSPAQLGEVFSALLESPAYQVVHFATSVPLPVDAVSLVGVARYDDSHDVLLWIRPSVW